MRDSIQRPTCHAVSVLSQFRMLLITLAYRRMGSWLVVAVVIFRLITVPRHGRWFRRHLNCCLRVGSHGTVHSRSSLSPLRWRG
ncbi:hypothetical protein AHAS_Ahas12G0138200 [Arachis hypogaea]